VAVKINIHEAMTNLSRLLSCDESLEPYGVDRRW